MPRSMYLGFKHLSNLIIVLAVAYMLFVIAYGTSSTSQSCVVGNAVVRTNVFLDYTLGYKATKIDYNGNEPKYYHVFVRDEITYVMYDWGAVVSRAKALGGCFISGFLVLNLTDDAKWEEFMVQPIHSSNFIRGFGLDDILKEYTVYRIKLDSDGRVDGDNIVSVDGNIVYRVLWYNYGPKPKLLITLFKTENIPGREQILKLLKKFISEIPGVKSLSDVEVIVEIMYYNFSEYLMIMKMIEKYSTGIDQTYYDIYYNYCGPAYNYTLEAVKCAAQEFYRKYGRAPLHGIGRGWYGYSITLFNEELHFISEMTGKPVDEIIAETLEEVKKELALPDSLPVLVTIEKGLKYTFKDSSTTRLKPFLESMILVSVFALVMYPVLKRLNNSRVRAS